MNPLGTPLELWTVARFPNGEWTTGGSPTSSDYYECEVFQVEATGRKDATRRAQQERRRKGYVPRILKAPCPMKTIRIQDMEEGLRYIVVKGTSCKTVQKGDHVWLFVNGDIGCQEAGGWLENCSTRRWEALVSLDVDFYKNQIVKATEAIETARAVLERHA